MSCVIGLVDKNKVYFGSDGIATTEDGDARPVHSIKIFKRGSFLLGFTGSIRTGQIIQRGQYTLPKTIWGWPDLIREQITKKGAIVRIEGEVEIQSSNFIIGHRGKLYELLADFQLNEVNQRGYTAIGSGATIALGSLFTTEEYDIRPRERIQKALEASTEFAKTCGPPFTIEVI